MHPSLVTPALLLWAGAVHAQGTTSAALPTTEEVFTIQTSIPSRSASACYEVCIQEPCPPCASPATSPTTSPTPSNVLTSQGGLSSVPGSMGIPSGETPLGPNPTSTVIFPHPPGATPISSHPIPSSVISQSSFTNPLLSTPPGPVPTNASTSAAGSPSGGSSANPSRSSGSAPAQQSTGAASPITVSGQPIMVVLAASYMAMFGAAYRLL